MALSFGNYSSLFVHLTPAKWRLKALGFSQFRRCRRRSLAAYQRRRFFCLMVLGKQVPGGVNAAKGFKATGMYGGLRAKGEKPDHALVHVDATAACAVLINAGQANAATGDAGYEDAVECANAVAMLLKLKAHKKFLSCPPVLLVRG